MIKFFSKFLSLDFELNKAISKNIAWLFSDTISRMILGLFVTIFIARNYGPEKYGQFTYCLAFMSLFGVISSLGLKEIAVREFVQNESKINKYFSSTLLLSFAGSLVAFLTLGITNRFIHDPTETEFKLILILGLSFLFLPAKTIVYYFDSLIKSKHTVKSNQIAFYLSSLAKLLVVYFSLGIVYLVSAQVLFQFLSGVFLFLLFVKYKSFPFKFVYDKVIILKLLKDSLPLVFSGFMIMLYVKIDQIMIKQMVSSEETGIYAIAVRLTEAFFFLPTIIYTSFYPSILQAEKSSRKEFYAKLYKFFKLNNLLSYLISIIVFLSAGFLVTVLFGTEYKKSEDLLKTLIWVLPFVSLGISRNAFLFTKNMGKFYLTVTVLSACTNIILNMILIPRYLSMGAVYATILSYSFSGLFTSFFSKKVRHIGFLQLKSLFLLN